MLFVVVGWFGLFGDGCCCLIAVEWLVLGFVCGSLCVAPCSWFVVCCCSVSVVCCVLFLVRGLWFVVAWGL